MSEHPERLEELQPPASLLIVGTGIQWGAQTTLAAERAIRAADHVLFGVADPLAARYLRGLNAKAEPLPYAAPGAPRAPAYAAAVARVLEALAQGGRVVAVFYGDPGFMTQPAHAALRAARRAGYAAELLPGVSALACLSADLGFDPGDGMQLYEATDFVRRGPPVDGGAALVLGQIGWLGQRVGFDPGDRAAVATGLARLQAALLRHFPATHTAVVYEAASHPLADARIVTITVGELSSVAAQVGDAATLFLPPREPRHAGAGSGTAGGSSTKEEP